MFLNSRLWRTPLHFWWIPTRPRRFPYSPLISEEPRCARPKLANLNLATSVDHAKTLAALLEMSGIKALSVDSGTDSSIRRKVVEDFRKQRVEVLVNYGVFREGFDAPKTRVIMVARPVYSPNLYFQMIGRGLRGPLNGGNERCLILNVRDNIVNYEERITFTELDWLWATGRR